MGVLPAADAICPTLYLVFKCLGVLVGCLGVGQFWGLGCGVFFNILFEIGNTPE